MAEETFSPKNIIVTGGCGFIGVSANLKLTTFANASRRMR